MKFFIACLCMTVGVATGLCAPRVDLRFDSDHLFAGEVPYITLVFRNDGDQTVVVPFARNRRRIRLRDEEGRDYIRHSETEILADGAVGPRAPETVLLQRGEWFARQVQSSFLLPPPLGDHTFRVTYETTGRTERGCWEGTIASNVVRLTVLPPPDTLEDSAAYALLKDGRDAQEIVRSWPRSVYAERLRFGLLRGCYPGAGAEVTVRRRAHWCLGALEELIASVKNAALVAPLRVAQAHCYMALGRIEDARAVIAPYIDPHVYPLEYQDLHRLGLAGSSSDSRSNGSGAVQVHLGRDRLLPREPVLLTVVLRGMAMSSEWLRSGRLLIEMKRGNVLQSMASVPATGPALLFPPDVPATSKRSTVLLVDVRQLPIRLSPGSYKVTAILRSASEEIRSDALAFSIDSPSEPRDIAAQEALRLYGTSDMELYSKKNAEVVIEYAPKSRYARYVQFLEIMKAECSPDIPQRVELFVDAWGSDPLVSIARAKAARCLVEEGAARRAKEMLSPYLGTHRYPLAREQADYVDSVAGAVGSR